MVLAYADDISEEEYNKQRLIAQGKTMAKKKKKNKGKKKKNKKSKKKR